MTKEGNVRIRLKGLQGEPVKLRILPKFDASFDINGIAEVPKFVADKLLGPACKGSGFELVTEEKPVAEGPTTKTVATKKEKIPEPKSQEQTTKEKEFAKSIVG